MSQNFKDYISRELWELSKSTWGDENSDKEKLVSSSALDYNSPRSIKLPSSSDNESSATSFGMVSEGVGSKPYFAERLQRYEGLGQDLLAMVLDDVARIGGTVLGLTTTIDVGSHLGSEWEESDVICTLMKGFVREARKLNIPLLDGEFSELYGRIGSLPFILNASALWYAKDDDIIDGSKVLPGDTIIALPETGFRSNGYTILRDLFWEIWGDRWIDSTTIPGIMGEEDEEDNNFIKIATDLVIQPSYIYYPIIQDLLYRSPKCPISGMVHVTGGGLPGKLKKYLRRSGRSAVVDNPFPSFNPLITYFLRNGIVSLQKAYETWNMGYGFLIITSQPDKILPRLKEWFYDKKEQPQKVGYIDYNRSRNIKDSTILIQTNTGLVF